MRDDVTLCLTIGRRPDLLARTLDSLGPLTALPVLAINDFGDAETSEVFQRMCPRGRLVAPGRHLGHHRAVDAIYAEVGTPFILHAEDDWQFDRTDFLDEALALLAAVPALTQVCLRHVDDMPITDADRGRIVTETAAGGIGCRRLDALHPQWHGFTFNPHLIRTDLWRGLGGYAGFAKERHLSRFLRAQGRHAGFLVPGACRHIGEDRSVANPPPSAFRRLRTWVRGR